MSESIKYVINDTIDGEAIHIQVKNDDDLSKALKFLSDKGLKLCYTYTEDHIDYFHLVPAHNK